MSMISCRMTWAPGEIGYECGLSAAPQEGLGRPKKQVDCLKMHSPRGPASLREGRLLVVVFMANYFRGLIFTAVQVRRQKSQPSWMK
jgi:hypothetical protein